MRTGEKLDTFLMSGIGLISRNLGVSPSNYWAVDGADMLIQWSVGVCPSDMSHINLMRPLNPSNDRDLCGTAGSCYRAAVSALSYGSEIWAMSAL